GQHVRRRAQDCIRLEVLHELNLTLGLSTRGRNGSSTERFHAVVRSQTAGKQAVAERYLDFIGRAQATGAERTCHQVCSCLDVIVVVSHHGGTSTGAWRSMETRELMLPLSKHAKVVFSAQGGFISKWELSHVGKFLEVFRVHADF